MNASQPDQRSSITIRAARAAVLAVGLAGTALGTLASTLDTRTVYQAEAASLYDTFQDLPSGFVFVKLPSGQHKMLDVRQHHLVRLSPDYARPVWQTLRKQNSRARGLLESCG